MLSFCWSTPLAGPALRKTIDGFTKPGTQMSLIESCCPDKK